MADSSSVPLTPPSPFLLLAEGQRAFAEMATLLPAAPILRLAPRGDGHPVMVLPGFAADDQSTIAIRLYLRSLGYRAHRWRLGRNLGLDGERRRLRPLLAERVQALVRRYERKVSLVGWSLGGIFAREIARALPDVVRQVITLGSPFGDDGHGSNVRRLYELVSGRTIEDVDPGLLARLREPPPVPSTAIYSRSDGVAAWRACMELESARTENIEVPGSHCGLGFNPIALYAIADRLAMPEDQWAPFRRSGLRKLFYR